MTSMRASSRFFRVHFVAPKWSVSVVREEQMRAVGRPRPSGDAMIDGAEDVVVTVVMVAADVEPEVAWVRKAAPER